MTQTPVLHKSQINNYINQLQLVDFMIDLCYED